MKAEKKDTVEITDVIENIEDITDRSIYKVEMDQTYNSRWEITYKMAGQEATMQMLYNVPIVNGEFVDMSFGSEYYKDLYKVAKERIALTALRVTGNHIKFLPQWESIIELTHHYFAQAGNFRYDD
jgi:hypothetical protein